MDSLETLKKQLNITDWKNVTTEQFNRMEKMIAQGDITADQLTQIIGLIPNFIDLQKEAIKCTQELIKQVGNSQVEACQQMYSGYNTLVKVLDTLAVRAESDELRMKIAEIVIQLAESNERIANKINDMNKDNNDTWVDIATGIGAAVAVAGSVIGAILWLRK